MTEIAKSHVRKIGLFASLLMFEAGPATAVTTNVTIDEIVSRAQIGPVALSPTATYAAYVVYRRDVKSNKIAFEVHVNSVDRKDADLNLAEYTTEPAEAIEDNGAMLPSAAAVRWLSDTQLLFLSKDQRKSRLLVWDAVSKTVRGIGFQHDQIKIPNWQGKCSAKEVSSYDAVTPDVAEPVDRAWHLRDSDVFIGNQSNPKLKSRFDYKSWSVGQSLSLHAQSTAPNIALTRDRSIPAASFWTQDNRVVNGRLYGGATPTATDWQNGSAVSANCRSLAVSHEYHLNLDAPDDAKTVYAIGWGPNAPPLEGERILTLLDGHRESPRVLGWSATDRDIIFLDRLPDRTVVRAVSLSGHSRTLYSTDRNLEVADAGGQQFDRSKNFVLLVQSSSTSPAQLVMLDLKGRRTVVMANPNLNFPHIPPPTVRVISVGDGTDNAWAFVYYPEKYDPRRRYPLVIAQYYCDHGFPTSLGDEIPILPLLQNGVAVACMNYSGLNIASPREGFQAELARLARPARAIKVIIDMLVNEGLIDRDRVGLSGLSWGAEIAMYEYWTAGTFKAVSTSSGSFTPSTLSSLGANGSSYFQSRGLPDPNDLEHWKALSAVLNVKPNLPPLLIQSGELERGMTVPTWTGLRSGGAPVDWYEYPGEGHIKQGPASKWWVFKRNLDWFRFWLQDYQDPDPQKKEQYDEWEAMKRKSVSGPSSSGID